MGKRKSQLMNLSYPIAKIEGFDVHLERSFYGVKLRQDHIQAAKRNTTVYSSESELQLLSNVTNIEYLYVSFLYHMDQFFLNYFIKNKNT